MSLLDELDHFIHQTKNALEIKRALAVKMKLQGMHYRQIQDLLGVSHQFISKWKNCVIFNSVEHLAVKYKGRKSLLTPQQKQTVIHWLSTKKYLRLSDLKLYLQKEKNDLIIADYNWPLKLRETKI